MLNSKHSLSSKNSKHSSGKNINNKEITNNSINNNSNNNNNKGLLLEPKVDLDFSLVPFIKQHENAKLLPKYHSVLTRNGQHEAVLMKDLDQLQKDLETLLATNALRTRFFLGEYTAPEQTAENKVNLKRKRTNDNNNKPNYVDLKYGLRWAKRDRVRSFNNNSSREIPKITLPRNDNSDKFWASIEPYCTALGIEDVLFLDSLIQDFSKDTDIEIPELVEFYPNNWLEDLAKDEPNLIKMTKKPEFGKSGLFKMIESFGTKHTQKLLIDQITNRALILDNREKLQILENECSKTKMGSEVPDAKIKFNIGQKIGACLDKRLLKVLDEELGILRKDEPNENEQPDDEILKEIKRCKLELVAINQYNLEELKKLRKEVVNDIQCSELKADLSKVQRELLDLYNNILQVKMEDEGKDYEEKTLSKKQLAEFEIKAETLLNQQNILNKEINSITKSLLY